MGRFKKIYILAPAGGVTGGPELLHQLGATLRQLGQDAYITYVPFGDQQKCPKPYIKYNVPIDQVDDTFGNAVLIPEVYTAVANKFKKATPIIWWLSVDNYSYQGGLSVFWIKRRLIELMHVLKGNRSPFLSALRKYEHLTQSYYAREFLKDHGITSTMLSDYLNEEHFLGRSVEKAKQIAFNPKKGQHITKALIKAHPDFQFVAIQGLDAAGVRELLERSMIYIDFGHHPGKDRMPREAAMAGCCVVTGRQGSAAFDEDVSIPAKYKLEEKSNTFQKEFRLLVINIFDNFDACSSDFSRYREMISNEKNVFQEQTQAFFC